MQRLHSGTVNSMNIFISYFYNIRFFPTNLIPVSTAMYDPKWYHNFKSKNFIYRDKRGIINGVRVEILSPYKINNYECNNCISHKDTTTCSFIKQYHDYIFSLNFKEVYDILLNISHKYDNSNICLIVYEKPDNPCSERSTLVDWFSSNGIEIKEFSLN